MDYPNITVEEAERVFEYLNLTLDDGTTGNPEKDRIIWEITNTIFHYAEDCEAGEEHKRLTDYPVWVQEFYAKASEDEAQFYVKQAIKQDK
jgi:hypothetical protein